MRDKLNLKSWDDIEHEFYSEEDILLSDLHFELIKTLIDARQEKGMTQKKLEELSGVSQPVIARFESGKTNPQLNTILKLLKAMGKTLSIVDLEQIKNSEYQNS